jgi:hypothetical protein
MNTTQKITVLAMVAFATVMFAAPVASSAFAGGDFDFHHHHHFF